MKRVILVWAALLFGGLFALNMPTAANAAPVTSSALFGATVNLDGTVLQIKDRRKHHGRKAHHRRRHGHKRRGWWNERGWHRRRHAWRHRKGCRVTPSGDVYCRF